MTMRQQRHPVGSFPKCPDCGKEPRHILDQRRRPVGGHLMSCACGDTTKHDTLQGALVAWMKPRNVSLTVRLVEPAIGSRRRQVAA